MLLTSVLNVAEVIATLVAETIELYIVSILDRMMREHGMSGIAMFTRHRTSNMRSYACASCMQDSTDILHAMGRQGAVRMLVCGFSGPVCVCAGAR